MDEHAIAERALVWAEIARGSADPEQPLATAMSQGMARYGANGRG